MHFSFRLQEHILPRRTLYFFTDQAMFTCCESQCLEVCNDDLNLRASKHPFVSPLRVSTATTLLNPLDSCSTMVCNYTQRALTNSGDILRAFEGIMRKFSQEMGYRIMQGVPIGAFDFFILFRGCNLLRRLGFLSYSWAGWTGSMLPFISSENVNAWLRERTWIIWYKRGLDGVVSLVWDPAANPLFSINDPKFEGYRERYPFTRPRERHRHFSNQASSRGSSNACAIVSNSPILDPRGFF